MTTPVDLVGRRSRGLLRAGMLLFLLGLLTGLALPATANPRMALSSHLEGVMNGIFLMVLGLAWTRLRLGERAARAGYGLVLFAAFANWATTLTAAFLGAGEKMMPLAAAGHRGSDAQELLIAIALVTLCVALLAASGIILWGLRGED